MAEVQLRSELAFFFEAPHDRLLRCVPAAASKRGYYVVDVVFPKLRIAVEFDSAGYHWRSDSVERDLTKTTALTAEGWTVIRVRELPLGRVSEHNVFVRQGRPPKVVAELVLAYIQKHCGVPVPGLSDYLQRSGPINAADADAEIDRLRASAGRPARTVQAKMLDKLLGSTEWRAKHEYLLSLDAETLKARARVLNAIFGTRKWKHHPFLLGQQERTTVSKAGLLDELLPPSWRGMPTLLGLSQRKVRGRVAQLDERFGGRHWTKQVSLVAYKPETLDEKAIQLTALVGNDSWLRVPELLAQAGETSQRRASILCEHLGESRARQCMAQYPYCLNTSDKKLQADLAAGWVPGQHRPSKWTDKAIEEALLRVSEGRETFPSRKLLIRAGLGGLAGTIDFDEWALRIGKPRPPHFGPFPAQTGPNVSA